MNSPPNHYPYHHFHDPTIINVHTLLKPQPFRYPSSSNTQSSPFASYTPFYQQPHNITTSHGLDAGISISPSTFTSSLTPPNLTHINLSHINFAIQELERSQKACLQAISNLSSDISTLNKYHTPPSTYNNTTSSPSPIWGSQTLSHHQQPINKDPQHSQYSIPHPTLPSFNNTPTLFNITQSHPYVRAKQICEQPANIFSSIVGQLKVVAEQDHHKEATERLPIAKLVRVATAITTESVYSVYETDETSATRREKVTHERKKESHGIVIDENDFSNISDSTFEIMDEEKGFVVETFNFDPVPDFVQERQQHVAFNSSNVVFFGVNVNLVSVAIPTAMDQHAITSNFFVNNIVRSSKLFDVHPLILNPGGDECRVWFLANIFGNGVCVFDHGGDERTFGSPTLISIKNHGKQSPLQLPWDKGKFGVTNSPISVQSFEWFLFISVRSITPPVTVFHPGGDKFSPVADSGGNRYIFSLLWLPWGRRVAVKRFAMQSCFGLFVYLGTLIGESSLVNGLCCLVTQWASKLF
ncbi:hypothetical protein QL285_013355 [Trifolium repens]|nr:hypothetical protein QL285_013355 [Trifolium repens]